MQTKTKAITGVVAMLVIASVLFAYPAFASQSSTSSNYNNTTTTAAQTAAIKCGANCNRPDLKIGSVITFTTASGTYWPPGHRDKNSSAAATLEYTVTGVFNNGYSLSLTAGSVTLGDTNYSLTSGSAELGPHGGLMVGQAAGANGFQLLSRITNLGNFGSANYAIVGMDVNNGSAQFYLRVMATVVVANPAAA
jgi:hypothetical protein